ncbi:hypothetical protein QZH41_008346 [Actinostola sp. cb2023]|nr:hypothetical protein QZH41_008346 [Actinostola sp. cb2023]
MSRRVSECLDFGIITEVIPKSYRSHTEVACGDAIMASWKVALYASVIIALIIVLLILNFDYLPKRKRSEELLFSKTSKFDSERSTRLPTSKPSLKEDEELSLEDFKTKTWNCSSTNLTSLHTKVNKSRSICYDEKIDPLMCFTDPVHCKQKLTNYNTRPVHWPKYGEYTYLPKSKWKYVIVHGGVLFLYHPCASEDLIKKIKHIAGSCLHRHVITPYEHLDPAQDFAVVAWGCLYSAKHFNSQEVRHWIRSNAMKAPAVHVVKKGGFREGLVDPARIVSDSLESELCPSEKSMYESSIDTTNKAKHQDDTVPHDHPYDQTFEEHVSIEASERIVIVRGHDGKLRERHKIDSVNAAWALGSLVFLATILVSVMIYVKPWRHRDYWWRNDDLTYDSNSKFSLLKNRKMFGRGNAKRSSAHAKLLGPIPEESDDDL